jgi:hypothetical protein
VGKVGWERVWGDRVDGGGFAIGIQNLVYLLYFVILFIILNILIYPLFNNSFNNFLFK